MKSSKVNELRIVSQLTTWTGAVVLVSAGLGAHPSVITRSRITGVIDPVTILPCPSSVAVTPEEREFTIHISIRSFWVVIVSKRPGRIVKL